MMERPGYDVTRWIVAASVASVALCVPRRSAAQETRPPRYALPPITVSAATPCNARGDDGARIASLWNETRRALTASEVAIRDRLFHATISEYDRVVGTSGVNLVRESRRVRSDVTERPFTSIAAESLSSGGYVTERDGELAVFAPDERVLLSPSFVRDHCFSLAPVRGDTALALAFEPVRGRRQRDIAGTIWLDPRSFALRGVTFRYTALPFVGSDTLAGGEVRFAHLTSGPWYVASWFIRTPLVDHGDETLLSPQLDARPRLGGLLVVGYRVQGGTVVPFDGASGVARAILSGRVLDSTGRRGLDGATVVVAGTPHARAVRRDGSFRFDSLPAGEATLLVEHPDYAALGMPAAEQVLTLEAGARNMTEVRAIGSTQVTRRLCGVEALASSRVGVRFVVTDSMTAAPVAGRPLTVAWRESADVGNGAGRVRSMSAALRTDRTGAAMLCGAWEDTPLTVVLDGEGGGSGRREWRVRSPGKGLTPIPLRR